MAAAADDVRRGAAVSHDQSGNRRVHAVSIDSDAGSVPQQSGPPPSTISSDPSHQRRRSRCFCAAVAMALLLSVAFLGGIVAITVLLTHKSEGKSDRTGDSRQSLSAACQSTLFPNVCMDSLTNLATGSSDDPQQMVQFSLQAASDHLTGECATARALFRNISADASPELRAALQDCEEFVQDSLDSLAQTLDRLQSLESANRDGCLADLETWMSASLTTQQTCLDGFDELSETPGTAVNGSVAAFVQQGRYSSMLLSNVLAFVSSLRGGADYVASSPEHQRRRLLATNEAIATVGKRRLLETALDQSAANVVVAQDGSGQYKRIQDAVDSAPAGNVSNNESQYVIYIKAGKYVETVLVPKSASNLVFLGDGVGNTIISGSLSKIGSNVTTSATATLTIQGVNFVGRNFTVENTAGAENHQAVAMRVTGDFAAFENCQFTGYQDTLYVHTNRQFYKNCTIVGTVDFIFGNAAVVLQNSLILASTGILGQQNTYTASGRTDPNQNTGISFQNCTFDGTDSLKNAANGTFATYLGRPWKSCARTVVMESIESSVLDPAGWLEWNGVVPNSTVYYGEYQNTGPGSDVKDRVPWSSQISKSNARKFTVDPFIQGSQWLPQNGITYIDSI